MRMWIRLLFAGWLLYGIALPVFVVGQEPLAETLPNADEFEPTVKAETPTSTEKSGIVRLIRVPLPIQGNVDTQVRRSIDQIVSNVDVAEARPTIVLEFATPAGGSGESSEFGRALELARFLAGKETKQAKIVAYLPETVRGHAVLVVLACEAIIMHPDAKLGAAGISESDLDDTMRQAYQDIAGRRLTIPSSVALGMLDPSVQVQRLTTTKGTRYIVAEDLAEVQKEVTVQKIDTVIPAGEAGLLPGDKLRLDYGFVSHLAEDRKMLAQALDVPAAELDVDPILKGEWNAVRIELSGPITASLVDQTIRSLEDELRRDGGPNFVCLAIDSPGGSLDDSMRLAAYLADLDSTQVRTVAYVPREARADAALVAMVCDKLVVQEDTMLGGDGAGTFSREEIEAASISTQAILTNRNRSWSLGVGMIDPDRSIHRYQRKNGITTDWFCEEELAQQQDPDAWEQEEEISPAGETLFLEGARAEELRLAQHVVADDAEFQQVFQLDQPPRVLKPNWAHEFISALANPRLAAGLLMIGFFAILIELHAPGIGIGGFVASVCFLLFFWSNFLNGTAGWLEVLLFLAGMIFISIEILVIPGFGIFGLGGGIMVLTSLVLASQTFVIPQNTYQMEQLPRSLFTVAAAMAGVGIGAVAMNRYLGESPLFRRFMLQPAQGEEAEALRRRESVVHYDHLLHKRGRTTTQLTPSGKADVEGNLYDVVSDGLLIPRGSEIEVIEVIGNKIVVREVKA